MMGNINTCTITMRELVKKACEVSPYYTYVLLDLYSGTDMTEREYIERL